MFCDNNKCVVFSFCGACRLTNGIHIYNVLVYLKGYDYWSVMVFLRLYVKFSVMLFVFVTVVFFDLVAPGTDKKPKKDSKVCREEKKSCQDQKIVSCSQNCWI